MGGPVVINESPTPAPPTWTQVGIKSLTTSNCLNNKTVFWKSNLTKDNFFFYSARQIARLLAWKPECRRLGIGSTNKFQFYLDNKDDRLKYSFTFFFSFSIQWNWLKNLNYSNPFLFWCITIFCNSKTTNRWIKAIKATWVSLKRIH
jgi:hypothetical protein